MGDGPAPQDPKRRDTTRTVVAKADRRRMDTLKTMAVLIAAACGALSFGYVTWSKVQNSASLEDVRQAREESRRNAEAIAEIRTTLNAQTIQSQQLLVQQAEMRSDVRALTGGVQRIERAVEALRPR